MGHSYIFLLIIMQEKLIYFQKMTSCKLRVTFSELFVEEYRKIELVGRSVARHLTNNNRIYNFLTKLRCRFQLLCKILVFGLR